MEDNVIDLYNNGKLIIRAVDLPNLHKTNDLIKYDCSTWANEFAMMMNNDFDSVSSTLLVPNVGVKTYKNVGFLVNSDEAIVQHIANSDSGSRGSIKNGDFFANKSNYDSLDELANYIMKNKSTDMNEVNLNIPINAVVGLVLIKSQNVVQHLKKMLIVREVIYRLSGIYFDLYEYDMQLGKINRYDITEDMIYDVFQNEVCEFDYYTDYDEELYEGSILSTKGFSR